MSHERRTNFLQTSHDHDFVGGKGSTFSQKWSHFLRKLLAANAPLPQSSLCDDLRRFLNATKQSLDSFLNVFEVKSFYKFGATFLRLWKELVDPVSTWLSNFSWQTKASFDKLLGIYYKVLIEASLRLP